MTEETSSKIPQKMDEVKHNTDQVGEPSVEYLSPTIKNQTKEDSHLTDHHNLSEIRELSYATDTPPVHDFAFYEWDFEDTDEEALSGDQRLQQQQQQQQQPQGLEEEFVGKYFHAQPSEDVIRSAISSSENTSVFRDQHSTPVTSRLPSSTTPLTSGQRKGSTRRLSSVTRHTIEELMQPSMYKSQLSRELGTTLAAELHSDMFGGIPAESNFTRRDKNRLIRAPLRLSTSSDDSLCGRSSDLSNGMMLPGASIPAVPTSVLEPTSYSRRYHQRSQSIEFPIKRVVDDSNNMTVSPDVAESLLRQSRSDRRSRTSDFHYTRRANDKNGENDDAALLRQRSAESGQRIAKLWTRLAHKKKKSN